MKFQSFVVRVSALLVMALSCNSLCFGAPASAEVPSIGLQVKMQARASNLVQAGFRPSGGALTPTRPALDLRVPDTLKPAEGYPTAPGRAPTGTASESGSTFQPSFVKSRSPAEEIVNRVHREGLPLARLWESKSALVSLGLNQKGQAGLWLIQRAP